MSNDLTKDEVSAVAQKAGCAWLHEPLAQRFATLCRAPLVAENAALKQAHEINADTLNAMQVEIDDWKARALKAEQAGEVMAWGMPDALGNIVESISPTEKVTDFKAWAAQYSIPLYATPPSAVPVVEQLLSALMYHRDQTRPINTTTEAIAAGQQYLKESGK